MKRLLVLLFASILLFSLASAAVEVDMKNSYSSGESIIAKISGNFLDSIQEDNVKFYRGHVRTSIPFEITKIDSDFYIYASPLNKEQGNYSLSIEGVRYYAGSLITDSEVVSQFIITNATADFYTSKGFVYTNEDFSLKIQNLQPTKIQVDVTTTKIKEKNSTSGFWGFFDSEAEATEDSYQLDLKSGEIKTINFDIFGVEQDTLKNIVLKSTNTEYNIPVFIFINQSLDRPLDKDFRFDLPSIKITTPTNTNTTRFVYLENIGETDLHNVSFNISSNLENIILITPDFFEVLEQDESKKITLTIQANNTGFNETGQITAKTEGPLYAYLSISMNAVVDYIPLNTTEDIGELESCGERSGILCNTSEGYSCSETLLDSSEGGIASCCLGSCTKQVGGSWGKTIGWLIVLVVIVFLVWFWFKKYKKVK